MPPRTRKSQAENGTLTVPLADGTTLTCRVGDVVAISRREHGTIVDSALRTVIEVIGTKVQVGDYEFDLKTGQMTDFDHYRLDDPDRIETQRALARTQLRRDRETLTNQMLRDHDRQEIMTRVASLETYLENLNHSS